MFCTNCGAKVADGARFCTNCGATLSEPSPAAVKPEPARPQRSVEPQPPAPVPAPTPAPAPTPKKKRSKAKIVIPIVAVVVVAAVAVAAFLTNGFGLMGVPVRATVNDYSWDELSRISAQISACGSEDEAIEIAKGYNLTKPDGTLDGTQVKQVELTDGTTTEVQIIGFYHDDKSDGSGKAGISFMFKDAIGQHAMNSNGTTQGGWQASEMRSWMNSELINQLPEDMKSKIVAVDKLTNSVGFTADPTSVTATSDQLWLLSQIEIDGSSDGVNPQYFGALDQEGTQYQLFSNSGIKRHAPGPVLQKSSAGSVSAIPIAWWQRSAAADNQMNFYITTDAGDGFSAMEADSSLYVVPAFCI